MSYSNDWSISGISGLTSLKDCYQGNGEKRLNSFVFLRRVSDLESGTTGKSVIFTDYGYLPINLKSNGSIGRATKHGGNADYYAIPGFMIGNYNIEALGALDSDGSTEDYYQHSEMYYESNYSPSTQKQGKYIDYYPTFLSFAENFSTNRKSIVTTFDQYQGKVFGDNASTISYKPAGIVQSDTPIFAFLTGTYVHSYPKIDQFLDLPTNSTANISPKRIYKGEGSVTSSNIVGAYEGRNNNYTLDTNLFEKLFMYTNNYNFILSINATMSDSLKGYYGDDFNSYTIYNKNTYVEISCDLTITRHLPGYILSNGNTTLSGTLTESTSVENSGGYLESPVFVFSTSYSGEMPFYFRGNRSSFNTPVVRTGGNGRDRVYDDSNSLGRVIHEEPSSNWMVVYKLDQNNYSFLNSAEQYQCPVFIAQKPLLNFERAIDSRNGNSTCYKVYIGSFPATMESTGGTITFFAYIYGNPEQVSLTLSGDSGTTSTSLSNGGRIYGDGVSHGQVTDGCLVYEGPGDTGGSGQGFGSVVNLAPIHGVNPGNSVGGVYYESTGSSSTDSDIYYIDFPRGFITSYSGYRINNFIRTNISDTISSSAVREDVYSTENQYNDLQYIEVTAVGTDGNTKTMTYGSLPASPTFRQTTIGGGSNIRFGWNPPSGYTIYGIMTLIVSIDGVQSTYTDSSVVSISSYHYKQYMVSTPTGDRDVQCLYSELRGGGDANHLDYVATGGTRP